jgi:hypothetical protein
VVPWLVSLWRKLRATVEVHQATNEEQQVLHLIEYVTSAIGCPVLAASDVDDLDDRLDTLIGSEALLASIQYLLAQHMTLFETAEPPSTTRVAAAAGESLGAAQARLLTEAQPMLDAWLSAQRQGIARYAAEMSTWAGRRRDLDLASPDLPAELAECLFHALRATMSIIAISCTLAGGPLHGFLSPLCTLADTTIAASGLSISWRHQTRGPVRPWSSSRSSSPGAAAGLRAPQVVGDPRVEAGARDRQIEGDLVERDPVAGALRRRHRHLPRRAPARRLALRSRPTHQDAGTADSWAMLGSGARPPWRPRKSQSSHSFVSA